MRRCIRRFWRKYRSEISFKIVNTLAAFLAAKTRRKNPGRDYKILIKYKLGSINLLSTPPRPAGGGPTTARKFLTLASLYFLIKFFVCAGRLAFMIKIKNTNEIELMRQGGKILAFILGELVKKIKPGVATKELDELAENLIYQHGAMPGFKGFNDYPTTLCASINEEIVHALPSGRKLKEGEIVSLDLGVLYPPEHCASCPMSSKSCGSQRGLYTDAAITVAVGKISPEAKKIIEAAKGALAVAVDKIKPGRKLSEVSAAIEAYVKKQGLAVIRELVGHGVGYELHEEPEIPNFDFTNTRQFKDAVLKEGMTLAVEPMVAAGSYKIKKSKDKFGYLTEDDSLAAHFEHTVVVTEKGCEVLTKI